MRQVDQESRFLDQASHFPLTNIFVRAGMGVVIAFLWSCGGIDGASHDLGGVPTGFSSGYIPRDIGNEWLTSTFLNGLNHTAHEDRMHGGVTDVVAGMHFDHYQFILNPISQVQTFQNQIEFSG